MGEERLTASGVITEGPAWLHKCIVTSDSGGVGDCAVYDGVDTNGILKKSILCPVSDMRECDFEVSGQGIECPGGIFLSVGSNITDVLVLWKPKEG